MDIRYAGFEVFIVHEGYEHHFSCMQNDIVVYVGTKEYFYTKTEINNLDDLTEYAIKYLKGEL